MSAFIHRVWPSTYNIVSPHIVRKLKLFFGNFKHTLSSSYTKGPALDVYMCTYVYIYIYISIYTHITRTCIYHANHRVGMAVLDLEFLGWCATGVKRFRFERAGLPNAGAGLFCVWTASYPKPPS